MTEERKERIERRKSKGIMGFFRRQEEAREKKIEEAELKKQEVVTAQNEDVSKFNKSVYIIIGTVTVLGLVGIYFLTKKK